MSNYDPRVTVLSENKYLLGLMTTIRNAQTGSKEFVAAFERVCAYLIPAALDLLPFEDHAVITPTGATFAGLRQAVPVCGVSILRAGASMEKPLRETYMGPLSFGTILIQRNEETCQPHEIYHKFPMDIKTKKVLIMEPMLATGGSAVQAISTLKEAGVQEEDIVFVNLLASKKGLERVIQEFPALRLVTAAVDENLTDVNHVSPGLGDFGDRFYGTTK
ncbi:hypothetical protein S40285_03098 [Stachybotrys chlorohalonatus IBT 40285]|uniref:uracil phosphoribosyltransferase n=1 Tax=Stachybotrys chlorohalonatus (strain IBT 40285) TaxID=1283841 RepID=A0A084QM86_STAC4|nr:hypothetical protein S40285_03098 [Stachybotrys chlorohalonata IBT 40285]